MSTIGVKEIWQKDDKTLGIVWTDHEEQTFDVVELRKLCPCAECVDEMTGQRKQITVAENVRPLNIKSVGRYAINIHFSDRHSTGIYTFELLRRLAMSKRH